MSFKSARGRPANVTALAEKEMLGALTKRYLERSREAKAPWNKLSSLDQQREQERAEWQAKQDIADILQIFTSRNFDVAEIKLGKFAGEGQNLEAKMTLVATDDDLLNVRRGGNAMIVFADAYSFFGRGDFVKVMPDQPDLMQDAAEREQAESDARAGQFKQSETVEPLEDTLARTAEGTAPEAASGEPVNETDGALIDNETGEVLAEARSPARLHRGSRRKALPAPAEA